MVLYLVIVFLVGLIIGSFLNVCIYRIPKAGMSVVTPRSHCPKCGQTIRWFDNIPLLSYLLLKGKCRYCRTPISWRYPLVELLTALCFTYAFTYHFPNPYLPAGQAGLANMESIIPFIVSIYLISTLIIISFIDFDLRIIPDELSISGIVIALILSIIFPNLLESAVLFGHKGSIIASVISCIAGIIAGGGIIYLVGVLGKLVFRKEAMGFGDVKLMAMLGGFLGWEAIIYVFFIGCFFGAIVGIISWLITREHYLPFGPYLALGALLMRFFHPQITYFVAKTYPEFIRNLFAI